MEPQLQYDFDRICRTCRCEATVVRSVFETFENLDSTTHIHEMLMACAAVEVGYDDGLPASICEKCVQKLQAAYFFKKQCESSDLSLREYAKMMKERDIKPLLDSNLSDADKNMYIEHFITENTDKSKQSELEARTDFIELMENNQMVLTCRECGKVFTTLEGLKCHKRLHTGALFKCKYCDKEYTRQNHLQRHELSHHRKKVHVCRICNKTLTRLEHLKRHLTTHLKEKPFCCSRCKRGFNRSEHLANHVLRCKGDRIHICDVCNKGFNRADSLQVHKLLHENQTPVLPTLENLDNIEDHYFEIDYDANAVFSDDNSNDVDDCFEPHVEVTEEAEEKVSEETIEENQEEKAKEEAKVEMKTEMIEDVAQEDEADVDNCDQDAGEQDDQDEFDVMKEELPAEEIDDKIEIKNMESEELEDDGDEQDQDDDGASSSGSDYTPVVTPIKRGRPRKHPPKEPKSDSAKSRKSMTKKIKKEEEEIGEFPCPTCQEIFPQMSLLEKHASELHPGGSSESEASPHEEDGYNGWMFQPRFNTRTLYIVCDDAAAEDFNNECTSPPSPLQNSTYTEEVQNPLENNPKSIRSRKRLKANFCCFCQKDMKSRNFARHLFRKHKDEPEVEVIAAVEKGSKRRKHMITMLRNRGNFEVEKDLGDTQNLPCTYCLGFYRAKYLWKHRKICGGNPNRGSSSVSSPLVDSQNLLASNNVAVGDQLRERIFPRMRPDEISLVAKRDPLICAYASNLATVSYGSQSALVISRKMRELAKLMMEMQKFQKIKGFFDALQPKYFDTLVDCVKIIAKYDYEKETCMVLTLAQSLRSSLKGCCDLALEHLVLEKCDIYGLEISREESEANFRKMIKLINYYWRYTFSDYSLSQLTIGEKDTVTITTLAKDLIVLRDHLIKVANSAISVLRSEKTHKLAYLKLIESILCRLMLLNRTQPGKLQKLHVHFCKSLLVRENIEPLENVLSTSEKPLVTFFNKVVEEKKQDENNIALLLSHDIKCDLEVLIGCRSDFFEDTNPFLFASPFSQQPIIEKKVLRNYALTCEADNPQAIVSPNLRKYTLVISQLFNMSNEDIVKLVSHTLGLQHSSNAWFHDVYHIAKISKLLILLESDQDCNFEAMHLEDIAVDLEENLLGQFDPNENCSENDSQTIDPVQNSESSDPFENVEASLPLPPKRKPKKSKKRVLVPWTEEQKKLVRTFFHAHIQTNTPPKRRECELLRNLHPEVFHNKDWLKMKVFVQNTYTKYKEVLSP